MKKHSKPRLAIDMDEVLADTLAKFLSVDNQEFGESVTKADLAGRHFADLVKPQLIDHVRGYARRPDTSAISPSCRAARAGLRRVAGSLRSAHRHGRHGVS